MGDVVCTAESPLAFRKVCVNIESVKCKSSLTRKSEPKSQGNYVDTFVKRMFGRTLVFVDFLKHYADPKFIAEIDVKKIQPAPTHYLGAKGDERIVDLVFQCPLKSGNGSLMAVIVFEHQSTNLKTIPEKLLRYISAIWDAERKEGKKVLSAPYFLVLRTGKKPYRKQNPTIADSLPKDSAGKPLGHVPEIRYDVVDLPAWDFDKFIGGAVLRSALMMLHTATGGKLEDFPNALQPLVELPEGERIEVTKELIDFVAKAFAAHNRRLEPVAASAAVETIFKGKGQKMIKTIFEEQRDIGIAEGEARGEAKRGRSMVLTVLRARFKRVPKEVEKAILNISDPIALESWAAHAATCETLDEFATALR